MVFTTVNMRFPITMLSRKQSCQRQPCPQPARSRIKLVRATTPLTHLLPNARVTCPLTCTIAPRNSSSGNVDFRVAAGEHSERVRMIATTFTVDAPPEIEVDPRPQGTEEATNRQKYHLRNQISGLNVQTPPVVPQPGKTQAETESPSLGDSVKEATTQHIRPA